jgi:hypothetical protein
MKKALAGRKCGPARVGMDKYVANASKALGFSSWSEELL